MVAMNIRVLLLVGLLILSLFFVLITIPSKFLQQSGAFSSVKKPIQTEQLLKKQKAKDVIESSDANLQSLPEQAPAVDWNKEKEGIMYERVVSELVKTFYIA